MPYRDTSITCQKCGRSFIFAVEEQRRMAMQGKEIQFPALCPTCRQMENLPPGFLMGTVKWYDPEKKYGFIVQQDGGEIFFHHSGIAPGGPDRPPDGASVIYRVESSARGPQAVDVALAGAEPTTGGRVRVAPRPDR
jgi:CspA family cold shock protein